MRTRNAKLPTATILQKHIESGMTLREIGARYDAHPETVRQALRRAGLHVGVKRGPPVDGPRARQPAADASAVQLLDDRTVLTKRVTATGTGGTAYLKIPLARVSMHIDQLQETGRC